jgi:hypothetical protein
MSIILDTDDLKARVFHSLKYSSLSSDTWEQIICSSMSATWVPGDKYLADGIYLNNILNIKTLSFNPSIKKKKENRDFLSHPNKEFDPTCQMIIQRRTNLPLNLDEQISSPYEIGEATLNGFVEFVNQSYKKFQGTNNTLDIIVRHGVDKTEKKYLVDIDIFDHQFHDPKTLQWDEVFGGQKSRQAGKRIAIEGYKDGKIVARRNGSNSGLYQTNYLIYKDLTKSEINYTLSIPLPKLINFDKDDTLKEIEDLESVY